MITNFLFCFDSAFLITERREAYCDKLVEKGIVNYLSGELKHSAELSTRIAHVVAEMAKSGKEEHRIINTQHSGFSTSQPLKILIELLKYLTISSI